MQTDILLSAKDLHVSFGGVQALRGASVALSAGEIVALLGPNGAGKSTVLKSILGLVALERGHILWEGQEVSPKPYEMVERGIAYVPQGRQIFNNLSVRENLEVGGYTLPNKSIRSARTEDVLSLFPDLTKKIDAPAHTLSGGQQQMLALARGLMTDPKVLLLDEPTLGLSPKLVSLVFAKIQEINEHRKTAILVVEHNIRSLLAITHRVYVLDKGEVVVSGSTAEVQKGGILKTIFTK